MSTLTGRLSGLIVERILNKVGWMPENSTSVPKHKSVYSRSLLLASGLIAFYDLFSFGKKSKSKERTEYWGFWQTR
jgi:hypothetical protein